MKMREEDIKIRIRDANQEDVNFIFSSWLKSYRNAWPVKHLNNTIYFAEQHRVIEDLCRTSKVLIACDEHDYNNIYGYICAEFMDGILIIHYIYVKHVYRNFGVAKLLLNQFDYDGTKAAICSHSTQNSFRLEPKFGIIYNPFVALCARYRNGREAVTNLQTEHVNSLAIQKQYEEQERQKQD